MALYVITVPFVQMILEIVGLSNLSNKVILLFAIVAFCAMQLPLIAYSRKDWLIENFGIGLLCMCAIVVSGVKILFNIDFYGLVSLIIILLIAENKSFLKNIEALVRKNREIIVLAIGLFIAIVAVYALFPTSYDVEGYLRGPFPLPHTLAYYSIVLYGLLFICVKGEQNPRWIVILTGLKGTCILLCLITGVRSAVLALGILVAYDFLKMRSFPKKLTIFLIGCLVLLYIVFFTDILMRIPVVQKTIEAALSGSVTNGRERFAAYAFELYNGLPIINKVIGCGLEEIRNVMFKYTNLRIHAHNDFINIFVGYGIYGFVYFIYRLLHFYKKTISIWGLAFLVVLIYFNGLYMYAGFAQCIPILAICFLKDDRKGVN